MSNHFRNFALWVVIALLLIALFQLFQNPGQRTNTTDISFSQFLTEIRAGQRPRRHDPAAQYYRVPTTRAADSDLRPRRRRTTSTRWTRRA